MVFVFILGFAVTNIAFARVLGRRQDTRAKLIPYECGMDPVGSAHQRFSVKFYLVAMLFILFRHRGDLPGPVGGRLQDRSRRAVAPAFVFFEMMIFIAVLVVGYVYVWKKGLFEWNRN